MGRSEELFARLAEQGEAALLAFIADRQSEELFLDFKRSADNGAGSKLHQNDRANLAKAVSGFGNSEGGVVIWGVDCRDKSASGDVAQTLIPISNPRRFVSWLEGSVSGVTVPAHPSVRHHALVRPDDSGFVLTHIPRSHLAPHQALPALQYHMRAGSDFVPVPHAVLQGMFGRPEQPHVFHMWAVHDVQRVPIVEDLRAIGLKMTVLLASHGPGLARDVFFNAVLGAPAGPSQAGYGNIDNSLWDGRVILGNRLSLVAKEGQKLSPEAIIPAIELWIRLEPPFQGDFSCKLSYGHAKSPTMKLELRVSASALSETFSHLLFEPVPLTRDEIYSRMLGIPIVGSSQSAT